MSTLSLPEAANRMKVHVNTAMRLVQTGEIPAAKIGRAYVMLESDVDSYIERQVMQQTAARMGVPMINKRRRA